MKRYFLLISLSIALFTSSFGQNNLIINTHNRQTTSLNGKWHYIIDQYETGYYDYRYKAFDEIENPNGAFYMDQKAKNKIDRVEYNFDLSPTLLVPRSWNIQDEKLFFYEGTIWYKKAFDYKKSDASNRVFVYFGAANYETDVYLNGKKLGKHIGGFTPFNYEITDLLKEKENKLIVKVDNKRKREAVPTINTDWFNYGGLTRDVKLVEVSETFVRDYFVQLKKDSQDEIVGYVQLDGKNPEQKVTIEIPELNISKEYTTNANGKAEINFKAPKLTLWSPENPKLYSVTIKTDKTQIKDQIGFRSIQTKGHDILLNGKSIFLRGICIHAENPIRGDRAANIEDARLLLNWAKELNCNFVRLAHYPHSEYMVRLADEMGLLVWEENPVYWTILWENKDTYENAKNQLTEIITRDKNRASVIIWSMSNETPVSEPRTKFIGNLADYTRTLDNTRFISSAMEREDKDGDPMTQIVHDPLADKLDIVSFNEYFGWYSVESPEICSKLTWDIPYDKPVIISEFGGGALQGYRADKLTRWTEDYQNYLFEETLPMLNKIPQFRGVTPWILCDFRSPKRLLPNIQDGWNRKGLISETGNKKIAFYTLQDFYNKKQKEYK